jgi:O-Antigen ligase
MRRSLLYCGASVLVVGPTAIAFFSGGYFDRPRLIAAVVAWTLVAVVAVAAPRPLPASTPARLALGALLLLCAWTTVSVAWAPLGGRALDDMQRLLLYLAVFFCALALLRGATIERWLEPALAAGALIVVGYALSERLLPGLVHLDHSYSAAGRLEQPLSYWNALGILAAMGLVLSVRVAGDPRRARELRAAMAGAGVPLGLAVYLTFGRGPLAGLAAGMLVLLALAPTGRAQLRGIVAVVGAAAAAAVLANRYPTMTPDSSGAHGDASEGAQMLAILVVLALAAAWIVWRGPRGQLRLPSLPVSRPTAVLTSAAALLAAAVFAVAVFEGKPEGESPVQRGSDPARLSSVDTNRYRFWDVALDTWVDHPLIGIGSGGFQVEWLKQRDRVDTSGDAHSIYIETAAELGVVGFAILLVFVAGVVMGVVRLYRLEPSLAAGPAALLATFAVHAGLDWDWEMPAVSLLALLMAGAVLAWSEERPSRKPRADSAADVGSGHRDVVVGIDGTGAPSRRATRESAEPRL